MPHSYAMYINIFLSAFLLHWLLNDIHQSFTVESSANRAVVLNHGLIYVQPNHRCYLLSSDAPMLSLLCDIVVSVLQHGCHYCAYYVDLSRILKWVFLFALSSIGMLNVGI